MTILSFKKIDEAFKRIRSSILRTPLITNQYINNITGAKIFFKLENLQWTGSFKLRGAVNKIKKLDFSQKKNGVVAYSSGNHAQAVAYASKINKINAKIVMPKGAPKNKIENTRRFGAEIILYDSFYESREEIANTIAKKEGRFLIKPYDDLDVIAGQGTAGKEIADQLLNINIKPDQYICCCGGGGLIAGSATYLKYKYPDLDCFSAEPNEFNDTEISLQNKIITPVKKGSKSICDALLAPQPGDITFSINQQILHSGVSVSDLEVEKTIIQLADNLKIIAEPGGAVAAAAILNEKINIKNKNIIVMISGGNIDNKFFSKIVNKL